MRFQWEVHCSLQTRKNWIERLHQFLEGAKVNNCSKEREREREREREGVRERESEERERGSE